MKTKLLVLGSSGMAGSLLFNYLKSTGKYEVEDAGRTQLHPGTLMFDIEYDMDLKNLQEYIEKEEPNFVINCIGLLKPNCVGNFAKAIFVNSYFPHWLEETTRKTKTKIIHLSTDCLFNGTTGNYSEKDKPNATDKYGRSKAMGELNNKKDLTIRMSIIGKEIKNNGSGLLEWVLKQKGTIKGYTNTWWSGITTLELAKAIDEIITKVPKLSGIFNLTPPYYINKYKLLKIIVSIWKKDLIIEAFKNKYDNKTLITKRAYSFQHKFPSSYKTMLEEYYKYLKKEANDKK